MNLDAATDLARGAPLPAAVANVGFGTAGWTDPSLIRCKRFYPRGVNDAEGRLRYYATQFPFVEVDASYYTLLAPELATRWLATTPSTFRFHLKAHASLTGHPIEVSRLPRPIQQQLGEPVEPGMRAYARELPVQFVELIWREFTEFAARLHAAGRLAAVLLQFPPWFNATRGNAAHVERVRAHLEPLPLNVEFRNASWVQAERRDRVRDWLTQLGVGYVVVDEPYQTKLGGVPPVLHVTRKELVVLRMHGQNVTGWRRGASVQERFDYLYSPTELARWVAPLRRLAEQAERVDVVFNNCVQDYAVLNAKGLSYLLTQPDG